MDCEKMIFRQLVRKPPLLLQFGCLIARTEKVSFSHNFPFLTLHARFWCFYYVA